MRLEDLYENFGKASPEAQLEFIAAYRLRRAKDLETIPKAKSSSSPKKTSLELSEEEKILMAILGLKKKDIIALRDLKEDNNPAEAGSGEDLFKDSTYEEGEES